MLVGDLNARPDAPELQPLFARFKDAWVQGGEGPGFTFSATRPDRRIDYVLVSGDIDVRSAVVLASPASDHLQLVTELAVPGDLVGGRPRATTAAVG